MIQKFSVDALSESEAKKGLISPVIASVGSIGYLASPSTLNCVCVCSLFLLLARHVCGVQLICASAPIPTLPVGTES